MDVTWETQIVLNPSETVAFLSKISFTDIAIMILEEMVIFIILIFIKKSHCKND